MDVNERIVNRMLRHNQASCVHCYDTNSSTMRQRNIKLCAKNMDNKWSKKIVDVNTEFKKKTSTKNTTNTSKLKCFSIIKFILFGNLLLVVSQYRICESSARWWSVLNEVAEAYKDENRNEIASNIIPGFPSSEVISQDYLDDLNLGKDSLYAGLEDLAHLDENNNGVLTEEAIFRILESSNHAGGAKLNRLNRQRRKGDSRRITPNGGSKKHLRIRKEEIRRNRDVSHTLKTEALSRNTIDKKFHSSLFVDKRINPLSRKQRRLLRHNPGVTEEISRGIRSAINECKFQFRNRKWRCPTQPRDDTVFGKILDRGNRESAFVYAVTSAAVAHAVAKGCSEGRIETCGCDSTMRGGGGNGWKWGGCSDNIDFGVKFSRDFVDDAEKGVDIRYRMNLHNNEAGRQAVKDRTVKFCKCHGMSGSCTIQTCWQRVDDFRRVGRRLRDKYDSSVKITQSNEGNVFRRRYSNKWITVEKSARAPRKDDFVHFENSPDFCRKDPTLWSEGTSGRTCNATSTGPNSCSEMCCGRGYRIKEKVVKRHCQCDFKWCCKVRCKICQEEKRVNVCN